MIKQTFLLFLTMLNLSLMAQNNGATTLNDTVSLTFGGRTKVNCPINERSNINALFGEKLGLKIETAKNYDRVYFDGDGFIAFVYTDNKDALLSPKQFINAMQIGLLVPGNEYEEAKKRLKQFGVKEHFPPYIKDDSQSTFFYFHAPGGQIIRLVNQAKMKG